MEKFPDVAFLKLTSKCNHNCRYCYDSKKHPDMQLSELKRLFELLSESGAKALVLSGGEPLMREDIPDIFEEIKKYGMKIYLDTNGDFFFKYKDTIDKHVDILGLPLDYPSGEHSFRNKENFENVIKILEYYSKKSGIKPLIRVGTVMTRENIGYLGDIAELLRGYKIDTWKIYQFLPLGPNGYSNRESLLIDSATSLEKTETIKKNYSKYFKVVPASRETRTKAYFFISSDGTLFMPVDNDTYHGDMELGNIFERGIVEKWQKQVNMRNYADNIQKTFNHKINK
jgi:MoaA/NifB/PqqE/SkfB family radical SAM enzyme